MRTVQNTTDDRIILREDREKEEKTVKTARLEVLDPSSPDTIFNMLIAEKNKNK